MARMAGAKVALDKVQGTHKGEPARQPSAAAAPQLDAARAVVAAAATDEADDSRQQRIPTNLLEQLPLIGLHCASRPGSGDAVREDREPPPDALEAAAAAVVAPSSNDVEATRSLLLGLGLQAGPTGTGVLPTVLRHQSLLPEQGPLTGTSDGPQQEAGASSEEARAVDNPTAIDCTVTGAQMSCLVTGIKAGCRAMVDASPTNNNCVLHAVLAQLPGSRVPFFPDDPHVWACILFAIRTGLVWLTRDLYHDPEQHVLLHGGYGIDLADAAMVHANLAGHLSRLAGAHPLTMYDIQVLQLGLAPFGHRLVIHSCNNGAGMEVRFGEDFSEDVLPADAPTIHIAAVNYGWWKQWKETGVCPPDPNSMQRCCKVDHFVACPSEAAAKQAEEDVHRKHTTPSCEMVAAAQAVIESGGSPEALSTLFTALGLIPTISGAHALPSAARNVEQERPLLQLGLAEGRMAGAVLPCDGCHDPAAAGRRMATAQGSAEQARGRSLGAMLCGGASTCEQQPVSQSMHARASVASDSLIIEIGALCGARPFSGDGGKDGTSSPGGTGCIGVLQQSVSGLHERRAGPKVPLSLCPGLSKTPQAANVSADAPATDAGSISAGPTPNTEQDPRNPWLGQLTAAPLRTPLLPSNDQQLLPPHADSPVLGLMAPLRTPVSTPASTGAITCLTPAQPHLHMLGTLGDVVQRLQPCGPGAKELKAEHQELLRLLTAGRAGQQAGNRDVAATSTNKMAAEPTVDTWDCRSPSQSATSASRKNLLHVLQQYMLARIASHGSNAMPHEVQHACHRERLVAHGVPADIGGISGIRQLQGATSFDTTRKPMCGSDHLVLWLHGQRLLLRTLKPRDDVPGRHRGSPRLLEMDAAACDYFLRMLRVAATPAGTTVVGWLLFEMRVVERGYRGKPRQGFDVVYHDDPVDHTKRYEVQLAVTPEAVEAGLLSGELQVGTVEEAMVPTVKALARMHKAGLSREAAALLGGWRMAEAVTHLNDDQMYVPDIKPDNFAIDMDFHGAVVTAAVLLLASACVCDATSATRSWHLAKEACGVPRPSVLGGIPSLAAEGLRTADAKRRATSGGELGRETERRRDEKNGHRAFRALDVLAQTLCRTTALQMMMYKVCVCIRCMLSPPKSRFSEVPLMHTVDVEQGNLGLPTWPESVEVAEVCSRGAAILPSARPDPAVLVERLEHVARERVKEAVLVHHKATDVTPQSLSGLFKEGKLQTLPAVIVGSVSQARDSTLWLDSLLLALLPLSLCRWENQQDWLEKRLANQGSQQSEVAEMLPELVRLAVATAAACGRDRLVNNNLQHSAHGHNLAHALAVGGHADALRGLTGACFEYGLGDVLFVMMGQEDRRGNTPLELAARCCRPNTFMALMEVVWAYFVEMGELPPWVSGKKATAITLLLTRVPLGLPKHVAAAQREARAQPYSHLTWNPRPLQADPYCVQLQLENDLAAAREVEQLQPPGQAAGAWERAVRWRDATDKAVDAAEAALEAALDEVVAAEAGGEATVKARDVEAAATEQCLALALFLQLPGLDMEAAFAQSAVMAVGGTNFGGNCPVAQQGWTGSGLGLLLLRNLGGKAAEGCFTRINQSGLNLKAVLKLSRPLLVFAAGRRLLMQAKALGRSLPHAHGPDLWASGALLRKLAGFPEAGETEGADSAELAAMVTAMLCPVNLRTPGL